MSFEDIFPKQLLKKVSAIVSLNVPETASVGEASPSA